MLPPTPAEEITPLPELADDLDVSLEGEGVTLVAILSMVITRVENKIQHECTESKRSSEIGGFHLQACNL